MSLSLLSEMGFQTGEPVRSSNQKFPATSEVTKLHAYLMKKVPSVCPEPSVRDVKELNEAIEKYGIADLYQTIEAVYRQKNKFWREKLKAATHPCSMLCRSLPTIIEQSNEAEEKRVGVQVNASHDVLPPKMGRQFGRASSVSPGWVSPLLFSPLSLPRSLLLAMEPELGAGEEKGESAGQSHPTPKDFGGAFHQAP